MPGHDGSTTFESLLSVETRRTAKKTKGVTSLVLGRLGLEPGAPQSGLQALQRQAATIAKQLSHHSQERPADSMDRVNQIQECLDVLSSMKSDDESPKSDGGNFTELSPTTASDINGNEEQSTSFLSDINKKAAQANSFILQLGLSDAVDNIDSDRADEINVEALGRLTETELAQAGLSVLQRVKVGVTMGRIAPGMEAMHTLLSQLGMAQYVQLFVDNEVDLDAFGLMTEEDIVELGVDNEFHRRVLLNAAQPSTLMQQCLLSMLSPENQTAAAHDLTAEMGVPAETTLKTESSLSQFEALDPETKVSKLDRTASKWHQVLKGASVEDELEACKRVIREMILERSTVISRLCREIKIVEGREATLIKIIETGSSGRATAESGNCVAADLESDKMEGTRLSKEAGMRAEAVEIDEVIVMMLGSVGKLSRGRSDKLQEVVLDHCAPILVTLVEQSLLLDWCSAILKHGLGEGNRLIWAVRAKLAEKVLFILAEDARRQAAIIETSLNTEVSSRHEYSSGNDWEVRTSNIAAVARQESQALATAPEETSSSASQDTADLDPKAPASESALADKPTPRTPMTPSEVVPEAETQEWGSGMSSGSKAVFQPIHDKLSPRSQLLPRLPPIDLLDAPEDPARSSPLLVKTVREDDGTGQAIPLVLDHLGFAVVAQPLPESLHIPEAQVGWRVLSIGGTVCRFKTLDQIQELFWREHGDKKGVSVVLVKGVDDSHEFSDKHEVSVPAGTVVVKAPEAAELEGSEAPAEQCYLVVLRRIPRAKSSLLSEAVGVGLTLQKERDGQFRVVSLLPGGAAAESGRVGQGDLVRSINGREVQGRSVEDVMQLIKGAPGTRVAILFAPREVGDGKAPRMRPHRANPGWKPKMGEIKVQVASGVGLQVSKRPPSIFCQLRILSTTLDEELVGVGRAGIEIGMRVHKSRFRKEKEARQGDFDEFAEEVGTVVNIQDEGLACQVLWDDATENWYATGLAGEFDLEISPEVTTMCDSSDNLRWDSVLTLGVRELETSFLECSVWNADELLGEAILQLSSLSEKPWEVVEKHLSLQDPDPASAPEQSPYVQAMTPESLHAARTGLGSGSVHLAVCWVPMPAAPIIDIMGGMLA